MTMKKYPNGIVYIPISNYRIYKGIETSLHGDIYPIILERLGDDHNGDPSWCYCKLNPVSDEHLKFLGNFCGMGWLVHLIKE